jgi:hypothetical protein
MSLLQSLRETVRQSRAPLLVCAVVIAISACATAGHASAGPDQRAKELDASSSPSPDIRSGSGSAQSSAPAPAPREEVISSGGELSFAQIPAASIQRANGEIVAWGLAEVPGDSRLQAALALVDANVRAELLSAIRVGIASSLEVNTASSSTRDAQSGTQSRESQQVVERVVQTTAGLLPSLAPIQHGWRKIRRDGVVVLQLCARIVAPEEALLASLRSSMPGAEDPAARARALLDRLGTGRALELK